MPDIIEVQYRSDVSGLRADLKQTQSDLKATEEAGKKSAKGIEDAFNKTASSVKTNSNAYIEASNKRKAQLDREIKGLELLRDAQKKAFDPAALKNYNQLIKEQEEKIKLLGGSLNNAAASTDKLASSTGGAAPKITKFYSGLRTLANIIPGIGISGLILQGYEFLITLFGKFTGSVEVNTEAIKINKEAIDKLNDSRGKLSQSIESSTERQLLAQGKLSDFQSKRIAAQDKFNESEIDAEKEKNKTLLALAAELGIKLTEKEKEVRDQNGKLLIAGDKELIVDLENNNKGQIDQINQFNKEKTKLETAFNNERKKAGEAFESEVAAIDAEALAEKQKKDADGLKKLKALNDKLLAERERLRNALIALDVKYDQANIQTQAKTEAEKIEIERAAAIQEVMVAEKAAIDIGVSRTDAENITQNALANIRANFDKKQVDLQKSQNDKEWEEATKFAEALGDAEAKIVEEKLKKRLAAEKKAAEERRKLEQETVRFTSDLLTGLGQINSNLAEKKVNESREAADTEIENLQRQYDNDLISKEQFEQRKTAINKKAADEEREIKRRTFETNKQISLIQTIISTAQATVAALGSIPYSPANIALAALTAAAGAVQIAVIESQPTPKFAKGGKIGGRYHTQGGTMIEAERDEWIIRRKEAVKNNDLLEAINSGKADKFILENYIAPALRSQQKNNTERKQSSFADNLSKSILINSGNFKDSNLLDSLKQSRKADRENILFLAKKIEGNSYNRRKW